MSVDWNFITGLEATKLEGYVPDAGDSGVTIGTGVDLGCWALSDLPEDLVGQLEPYLGLRGDAARQALQAAPLTLSEPEVEELDAAIREKVVAPLATRYEAGARVPFASIPAAAQTVIASVAYQYGAVWHRCPRFWGRAVARDWSGVIAELRAFGDGYPTRRRREAAYLEAALRSV